MDQERHELLLELRIIPVLFEFIYTIQPFRMKWILRAAYTLAFVARNEVTRGLYFFERRYLAREKISSLL